MPTNEHLVLCGGVDGAERAGTRISLNLHGSLRNVHLKIADISKRLLANIPDALVDLVGDCQLYLCGGQRNLTRWPSRRTDGYAVAAEASVRNPSPIARPLVLRSCRVRAGGDAEFSLRGRIRIRVPVSQPIRRHRKLTSSFPLPKRHASRPTR